MANVSIEAKVSPGISIDEAVKSLLKLAKKLDIDVTTEFNDVRIIVLSSDTLSEAIERAQNDFAEYYNL